MFFLLFFAFFCSVCSSLFVFKVLSHFEKITIDQTVSVCVIVSVCLSLESDSSETTNVIIIKLGTVTRLHQVFIILTLTSI